MGRKRRFTARQVVEALEEARGIVSDAATILGCTRATVYNYIKRYQSIKRVFEEKRLEVCDLAMSKLVEKIEEGDLRAIIFFLRTFGSHRGY